ncbi:MAG: hypothetical protein AB1603_00265 [Chloroflexota bacterium]
MNLEACCRTTAMGIMPHRDVGKALELALSLDVPFWPQLPNVSFREDMYAQTSEGFPGVVIDPEAQRVSFDSRRFDSEIALYSEKMAEPGYFALGDAFSVVYHRFMEQDLRARVAIRGQVTGPVSFGFRVVDENQRPIIYNDAVRALFFDFVQKKTNAQYAELRQKNANAFVWVDEPGLGWVFSGLSGYNDAQATQDYHGFLEGLAGPRALHLCANVNLPYLLDLGVELLSFDAYQIEVMPKGYASSVAAFLERGGIIAWGIVPTDSTNLGKETVASLARLLEGYWRVVSDGAGIPVQQVAKQSLLAPARCCLKNIGEVGAADEPMRQASSGSRPSSIEEYLVETAFARLEELSQVLRQRFDL